MTAANARISLIIPLRLTAATFEGALRLDRICRTVPDELFEIIISDYGTADAFAGPLNDLESRGIRVVRHPDPHALFSIGHCRDFGVQRAACPVVMFHDIDFLADSIMYRRIHAEAMARDMVANTFDFFCVPVLFLSEAGTQAYFAARQAGQAFLPDFSIDALERRGDLVQTAAFGSSAMVINRHHYLASGGHDRRFHGHGAEDYDLLHRLSSIAPKGPRTHDYMTDFKSNNVRNYWGFRAYFALYGLDVYSRGIFLVHLWHPRRQEKGYFQPRRNFRILRKAMQLFDKDGRQPDPLPDLNLTRRISVHASGRKDALDATRHLLPFFGAYSIHASRKTPKAAEILAQSLKDGAGTCLILPGARPPDLQASLPEFAAAAIRPVLMVRGDADGKIRFVDLLAEKADPASSTLAFLRTIRGRPVKGFFDTLSFPGIDYFGRGRVPAMTPPDSPLYAAFGGSSAFDRKGHAKPRRARKSSLWVRIKRFVSGY